MFHFWNKYYWKTLTRLKGIETFITFSNSKSLSEIERHWPDLRGLKQVYSKYYTLLNWRIERHWPDLRGLKQVYSKYYTLLNWRIERHWPDLRGLKHSWSSSLNPDINWKTLTRLKGIETPLATFSSLPNGAVIERHWPDLRGLKRL